MILKQSFQIDNTHTIAVSHRKEFLLALLLGIFTLLSSFTLAACSAWLIIRAWERPTPLELTIVVVSVRTAGLSRAIFRYSERVITHRMLFMERAETILFLYRQRISAGFSASPLSGNMLISVAYQLADVKALVILPFCIAASVSGMIVIFYAYILWQAALLLGILLFIVVILLPFVSYLAQNRHLAQATSIFDACLDMIDMILQHREELHCSGALEHYQSQVHELLLHKDKCWGRSYRVQALVSALQMWFIGIAEIGCCYLAWLQRDHFSAPTLGVLMLLPLLSFEAASLVGPAMHQALLARDAKKYLRNSSPAAQAEWIDPVIERIKSKYPQIIFWKNVYNVDQDFDFHDPSHLSGHSNHSDPSQKEQIIQLLTGPNGIGKTSTLLYLAGLIPAFQQENLPESAGIISEENARTSMALLADSHIFNTSIKQNLLLAKAQATDQECEQVLAQVGLWAKIQQLVQGVDAPARNLSRGQKKLLALSQWLIAHPLRTFIDEPLENLNPARLDTIMQLLLARDVASHRLIATHDDQLIRNAQAREIPVVELNRI